MKKQVPPPNFGKPRQDWFDTYHLPEGGCLRIMLKVSGPSSTWILTNREWTETVVNHDVRTLGQTLTSPQVLALFTVNQLAYYRQFVLPMIEQRLHEIYSRIQQEKFSLKNWPLAMRNKRLKPDGTRAALRTATKEEFQRFIKAYPILLKVERIPEMDPPRTGYYDGKTLVASHVGEWDAHEQSEWEIRA